MYHNGFVNKSLKESNLLIRGTTECQIKKTQSAGDGNYMRGRNPVYTAGGS